MSQEITVSRWYFDRVMPAWTASAIFTSWTERRSAGSSRVQPAIDRTGYEFAFEDLAEIAAEVASSEWSEPGIAPTPTTVQSALGVLELTSEVFPAPEVTTRETGTLLMLWHAPDGFLSLEVGSDSFGMIGSREGFPSIRENGRVEDLASYLPHRRHDVGVVAAHNPNFARRALLHMATATNVLTEGVAGSERSIAFK